MPLLAHDDDAEISVSDDEDDEFPPVEETMDEMPVAFRVAERAATSQPSQPSDFVGHTPPPFGADSSTSGASLQPLTPPVPPPRRSIFMPILVVMMVMITGAALFLVWRMMQKSEQQQPNVPKIEVTNAQVDDAGVITFNTDPPKGSNDPGSGSATEPIGPGSAVVTPKGSNTAKPNPGNPPLSSEAFQRALNATVEKQKAKLVDCVAKHGVPPAGTVMVLAISTEGKATSVSFTTDPDKGFQSCVVTLMTNVSYPKPPVSWVQKVTLRAKT
jgi:hypothetical protein